MEVTDPKIMRLIAWDYLSFESGERGIGVVEIYQAESSEHRQQVRELFWEYLQWANQRYTPWESKTIRGRGARA
jgi:hypothetical protein